MKIIKESIIERIVDYKIFYERINCPNSGYSFDCDESGAIDENSLTETKKHSLELARNKDNYIDRGIEVYRRVYKHPAIGECLCGCEVELHSFTNTCYNCSRDYNMSGDLLANREQWGEETGEHWSECI